MSYPMSYPMNGMGGPMGLQIPGLPGLPQMGQMGQMGMNPLNPGMAMTIIPGPSMGGIPMGVPMGGNIPQMGNLPPGMGLPPNPQMIPMGSAFQPNPTDILAKKKEFLK